MMGLTPIHFHIYQPQDMTLAVSDVDMVVAEFTCRFCKRPIIVPWMGGWNAISVGCGGEHMHYMTFLRVEPGEGEEWKTIGAR